MNKKAIIDTLNFIKNKKLCGEAIVNYKNYNKILSFNKHFVFKNCIIINGVMVSYNDSKTSNDIIEYGDGSINRRTGCHTIRILTDEERIIENIIE